MKQEMWYEDGSRSQIGFTDSFIVRVQIVSDGPGHPVLLSLTASASKKSADHLLI